MSRRKALATAAVLAAVVAAHQVSAEPRAAVGMFLAITLAALATLP